MSVGKVGMLTPSGRVTCKRGTRNAIAAAIGLRNLDQLLRRSNNSCLRPGSAEGRAFAAGQLESPRRPGGSLRSRYVWTA